MQDIDTWLADIVVSVHAEKGTATPLVTATGR
jgi:hypothetical protein